MTIFHVRLIDLETGETVDERDVICEMWAEALPLAKAEFIKETGACAVNLAAEVLFDYDEG